MPLSKEGVNAFGFWFCFFLTVVVLVCRFAFSTDLGVLKIPLVLGRIFIVSSSSA